MVESVGATSGFFLRVCGGFAGGVDSPKRGDD